MNVKYNNGDILINLTSIFECMSGDDKLQLIERLSCEEEIIQHVADQITKGFTVSSYSGSSGCCDFEPHTALDKARRQVANMANDVAKSELDGALRSLKHEKAWREHYEDWAFKMFHAWGKQHRPPEVSYPTITDSGMFEVVKRGDV